MISVDKARQNPHRAKNAVFVLLIVSGNAVGNLLLAMGMNYMPDFMSSAVGSYAVSLLTNPHVILGTILLTVALIAQLTFYTWADLTYILPVTASGYVLVAILGKYVLNERISPERWAGIALISLGVMFVSDTPFTTKGSRGGC
jgi:drug/metabolite transporter (DMT)-like permease